MQVTIITKLALTLLGLFRQDVTAVLALVAYFAGSRDGETLGCGTLTFHLWHLTYLFS